MAVAFVQKTESGGGTSTTRSPTMPTGIAANNLLVLSVLVWQGAPTVSTPSGWTKALDGDVAFASSNEGRFYVFVKKAVGSDSSPLLTASGDCYWVTLVEEYSGQDQTTPLDGTASHETPSATSTVPNPAITTTVANSLILYFEADTAGGGVVTEPAGATVRHNAINGGTGFRIVASDKAAATPGTVAATSHSRTTTVGTALGATMAIRAAATVVTPVADFTGTPLTGSWPLNVTFTDASANSPTSWAWTFGDGGTSTSQNPSHSYTAAGTYTVVLVATNAGGSNTKTRTAYVTVSNPSGTFTKIEFGDHLKVTDLGGGVIRVDYV